MTPRLSVLLHGLVFLALCVFSSGCALLGGVHVKPIATSVQKPSNVALYVSVREWRDPVPGLLVLVDMSSAADDESKHTLSRAVAGFVGRTRGKQGVTVYAFDGSAEPELVGEFPRSASGEALEEIAQLSAYSVKDPSRNLHGAIVEGLKQLDARLLQVQKPIRIGTLVVFTAGPDVAGRLSDIELRRLLDKSPHQLVSIGVGHVPRDYYLDDIGRSGVVRAQDRHTLGIAFEEAATKVASLYDMYYLVSYCSPARAGQRTLRLQVAYTNAKGEERKGSASQRFDATGFGPGCDSKAPPHFVMNANATEAGGAASVPSEPGHGSAPAAEPKPEPNKQPSAPPPEPAPDSDSDAIVPPPAKPGYAPQPH